MSEPTTITTPVTVVPVSSVLKGDVVVHHNKRYQVTNVQNESTHVLIVMKDVEPRQHTYYGGAVTAHASFQLHDYLRVLHHVEDRPTTTTETPE